MPAQDKSGVAGAEYARNRLVKLAAGAPKIGYAAFFREWANVRAQYALLSICKAVRTYPVRWLSGCAVLCNRVAEKTVADLDKPVARKVCNLALRASEFFLRLSDICLKRAYLKLQFTVSNLFRHQLRMQLIHLILNVSCGDFDFAGFFSLYRALRKTRECCHRIGDKFSGVHHFDWSCHGTDNYTTTEGAANV